LRFLFHILVVCSFCVSGVAAPKRKKKKTIAPSPPAIVATPDTRRRLTRGIAETPAGKISRFKLINTFGIQALSGAGITTGGQFGYTPNNSMRFYWGPAMDFTLFSQGYLFNLLAGFWYEWRCLGADNVLIHVGALAGAGFSRDVASLGSTNLSSYVDLAIATELDDLVTLRGQLRPGFVGSRFAFLVNFNVMFRFY